MVETNALNISQKIGGVWEYPTRKEKVCLRVKDAYLVNIAKL